MTRRLVLLALCLASPALADTPTIDRTVLGESEERNRKVSAIETVDKDRFVNNRSITCAMYRAGRSDDPVGAANANPAIAGMARRIAQEEGIDENPFLALVYQESRFNPCARSPAGAIGLAQLMPGTASDLGVNPFNIEQNLRGGARYYKQALHRYRGNIALALAAYNAGHGNVQKYGGIPPFRETQVYVANITAKWLPAFGGSDKSGIPLNYGYGGAYETARASTMGAMGLTTAIGEGSGDVASWFEQFGQSGTGTIQDSWDQNAGVRNATIELLNRLILLGTAFADLTNSSNAITLGDLSGANRSTRYKHGGLGDDRPMANFCGGEADMSWSDAANGCVQGVDAHAELLIRPQ